MDMNNEKMAIAETMMEDRAKHVQAMMDSLAGNIDEMIESAMQDSCTVDEEEARDALKVELLDEINEYIRRGLQRGIKRVYTEYSK